MGKSTFKISYVEKGYEEAWREFWCTSELSEETSAAHAAGKLGQTEWLDAHNLEDAMAKVRKKYPGHTVMREGSSRIGG